MFITLFTKLVECNNGGSPQCILEAQTTDFLSVLNYFEKREIVNLSKLTFRDILTWDQIRLFLVSTRSFLWVITVQLRHKSRVKCEITVPRARLAPLELYWSTPLAEKAHYVRSNGIKAPWSDGAGRPLVHPGAVPPLAAALVIYVVTEVYITPVNQSQQDISSDRGPH